MATVKILPCRCGRVRPAREGTWTIGAVECVCGLRVIVRIRQASTEGYDTRVRRNIARAVGRWNAIHAACAQAGVTWDR